jgi:hypothetical protein
LCAFCRLKKISIAFVTLRRLLVLAGVRVKVTRPQTPLYSKENLR